MPTTTSQGSPLKTEIGFGSELEAAQSILKGAVPIKAITLQIGSNDELGTITKCFSATYRTENGYASPEACIAGEVSLAGHAVPGWCVHPHPHQHRRDDRRCCVKPDTKARSSCSASTTPRRSRWQAVTNCRKRSTRTLKQSSPRKAFGEGVTVAQPFSVFNPEAALYKGGESAEGTRQEDRRRKKDAGKVHRIPRAR